MAHLVMKFLILTPTYVFIFSLLSLSGLTFGPFSVHITHTFLTLSVTTCVGFPTTNDSVTQAGCPRIYLNSNTVRSHRVRVQFP